MWFHFEDLSKQPPLLNIICAWNVKKDLTSPISETPKSKYNGFSRVLIVNTVFFMVEISRLFWKKVYTSDAFLVGEIESAELDRTTWQITNFYVSLTDGATQLLGLRRPFMGKVMVCLPVSLINTISDTAILNKTRLELNELKECKE
jgi:sporulation protein YlmC with PRC-barrel domain